MMVALLLLGGLGVALLGSVKLPLAERLRIEEARVGGLVSLFGFVLIPMNFAAGFLTDHVGRQPVLVGGSVLFAAGLAVLAAAQAYAAALAAVVLLSAAWSLLINVGNVLAPAAFPGTTAQANNLANVFFGLGAFLTPLLVVFLLRRTSWRGALGALAVAALVPGALALGAAVPAAGQAASAGDFAGLLADPVLWLCGLALFCYGPLEASMAAWTTTYLTGRGIAENKAAGLLSAFWLAFMASRLAAALALPPGGEAVAMVALACACAAVLLGVVLSARPAAAAGLVVAAGVAFGPVFPLVMARLWDHFADEVRGRAIGLFFAIGGLGWTLLPMLIGAYATRAGVQRAFALAVGAAVGLIAVAVALAARPV
jgi:fucose permease